MSLAEQFESSPRKTARRVRNGRPSNELVFSACQGTNDELFPSILSLYVAHGSTVADITYGKGVFWKRIDRKAYRLKATDLATGTDSRKLPLKWTRLSEQIFRLDKWNLCQG